MPQPITLTNAAQLTELALMRHGWITQITWNARNWLAVGSAGGVYLYPKLHSTPMLLHHEAPVKSIAFHSTGAILLTGSSDTKVRAWGLADNPPQSRILRLNHNDAVETLSVIRGDGFLIASGAADGSLQFYDAFDRKSAISLGSHTAEVSGVAFSPDGKLLASGGRDNTVRLWDVESHEQRAVLPHDDWVREVAFSPDGTLIASACKDGTVNLWDVESGQNRLSLQAHTNGADCLAFNRNGVLATGGRDNLIKLWDCSKGELVATLPGHTKPVLSVAFSPSGTTLASGSGDNTVRIWGVSD